MSLKSKYSVLLLIPLAAVTLFHSGSKSALAQQPLTAQIVLDESVANEPVSGRLLLFFSDQFRQPMLGPSWFNPDPFFGLDVSEMAPGATVVIDDRADAVEGAISELADGEYYVQAILDHDFYYAKPGNGPGNFYSEPLQTTIRDGQANPPIELTLNQVVEEPEYQESRFVKFVEIQSELLERFHGRPVVERAMVVLPASYYEHPERRYPVSIDITGFGATLQRLQTRWRNGQPEPAEGEAEFIHVHLTGQCKWGHHVYANSATNGPRGDMLVSELIPAIDQRFRTIAAPTARFVGGHSSGGWSSLWLQTTYPDFFGGVWSTAPDPVDFRDWQGTNLYEPGANVYFDEKGNRRPLARRGSTPIAWYDDFTRMDDVLGRGGQIRSFDAVFSPRNENGLPAHAWDRETGQVNEQVIEHWKNYDISLNLKENWSTLGPKLQGKLHVYMGEMDTFYLEGATILLGERLKALGSDAVVEIFPGRDHGSLLTHQLRSRIRREMSEKFWENHPRGNR